MRLKQFKLSKGCDIFKAFGDEARVRILNILYHEKEVSVSDLEQILDFTQTKTSRHLIKLKNAGIVNFKKIDQWQFYFLKDELIDFVGQFFMYFEKDATLLRDIETYEILRSNRELAVFRLKNKK